MTEGIPSNPGGSDNVDAVIERMLRDQAFRMGVVRESPAWFFYFYFPHYIKYEMAEFHERMFALMENKNVRTAIVIAFRGASKSTLFVLSFPLWAILGSQEIKHVLILSSTHQKAQQLLQNIKRELETNHVLRADLGPFREEKVASGIPHRSTSRAMTPRSLSAPWSNPFAAFASRSTGRNLFSLTTLNPSTPSRPRRAGTRSTSG